MQEGLLKPLLPPLPADFTLSEELSFVPQARGETVCDNRRQRHELERNYGKVTYPSARRARLRSCSMR